MNKANKTTRLNRRNFVRLAGLSSIAALITPVLLKKSLAQDITEKKKPGTNISDALAYPRKNTSIPGKFPGQVVKVYNNSSIDGTKIDQNEAYKMVEAGLLQLTGASTLKDAWKMFIAPDDVIAIKVNPITGTILCTSHEVTDAVISQLEQTGIPRQNIILFDRRDFDLANAGFTAEKFPGIRLMGTEQKDKDGSFYDVNGMLYSEQMIDKNWYYWADVEGEYDAETLPYMVNGGKYSYFSKIITQLADKIINIPVLKNHGTSVTICMKNMAYGCISNTARLHKDLYNETCAEVCAFPPIRDKLVLNIVDGIRGCYEGGPDANPQYILNYKTLLIGTDPVALDRVGYEMILEKRIQNGIQQKESKRAGEFMFMAEDLKLGTANPENISIKQVNII